MKLLLIDDEERLVFEGNLSDTKMHIKAVEPEYKAEDYGFIKIPVLSQSKSYSLDFKADLVTKENYALKMYPDRLEEADIKIDSCYTRGKAQCIHEKEEKHRAFCTDWVCYCE